MELSLFHAGHGDEDGRGRAFNGARAFEEAPERRARERVRPILSAFARRVNDILRHASLYAAAHHGGFARAALREEKSARAYAREKLMTWRALFATL
jgi:hypothetical protein